MSLIINTILNIFYDSQKAKFFKNMLKFLRFSPLLTATLLTVIASVSFQSATSKPASASNPLNASVKDRDLLAQTQTPLDEAIQREKSVIYFLPVTKHKEDWEFIAALWQDGINSLKTVSRSSANYPRAQEKIQQFQEKLAFARTQAAKSSPQPRPTSSFSSISPARLFLEKYLEAIVKTKTKGYEYWCPESEAIRSSFYSPTSYTIVDFTGKAERSLGTVVIASEKKDGSPLVATWNFLLANSPSKGWCIKIIAKKR